MAIPYQHVLAPTDFSEAAAIGVAEAVALANAFGARLTLVHVYEAPGYAYAGVGYMTGDYLSALRETAEKLLAEAVASVRAQAPRVESALREGASWDQILAVAREARADVIVLSTHGRTGIAHALLGSVAEKVVRHAPVPVLTVPAGARR